MTVLDSKRNVQVEINGFVNCALLEIDWETALMQKTASRFVMFAAEKLGRSLLQPSV